MVVGFANRVAGVGVGGVGGVSSFSPPTSLAVLGSSFGRGRTGRDGRKGGRIGRRKCEKGRRKQRNGGNEKQNTKYYGAKGQE